MGSPRTQTAECQYKEYYRLLTDQFIIRLNSNCMIDEFLKEVATLEDTADAMSECVLLWTCRVEVQRAQKSALSYIKKVKEVDVIRTNMQNQDRVAPRVEKKVKRCKYCGTGCLTRQCPVYGKKCGDCRKQNCFKSSS